MSKLSDALRESIKTEFAPPLLEVDLFQVTLPDNGDALRGDEEERLFRSIKDQLRSFQAEKRADYFLLGVDHGRVWVRGYKRA